MRVLLLDNNLDAGSWGAEDLRRVLHEAAIAASAGVTIQVRRPPGGDLPRPESLGQYAAVVMSGSRQSSVDLSNAPWAERLIEWIPSWIETGRPLLGVCFGHQILARALGGRPVVRQSPTPEFGWTRIRHVGGDPLFHEIPETFYALSRHFEDLAELPPHTQALASSARCDVQAFRLTDKLVYGVQFHPERTETDARESVDAWLKNKILPKGYVPEVPFQQHRYNAAVRLGIFKNFLAQTQ